jgi:hypothetical protein
MSNEVNVQEQLIEVGMSHSDVDPAETQLAEAQKKEAILAEAKTVFNSLLDSAKDNASNRLLEKLVAALKKPKTPTAATAAIVEMYRAIGSCCKANGYIGVNTAGRIRRRKGVSKGAKKVPMGRPSQTEVVVRGPPKRQRNHRQAVNENCQNAKTH